MKNPSFLTTVSIDPDKNLLFEAIEGMHDHNTDTTNISLLLNNIDTIIDGLKGLIIISVINSQLM